MSNREVEGGVERSRSRHRSVHTLHKTVSFLKKNSSQNKKNTVELGRVVLQWMVVDVVGGMPRCMGPDAREKATPKRSVQTLQ